MSRRAFVTCLGAVLAAPVVAGALGLTIPASLLARADQVIVTALS